MLNTYYELRQKVTRCVESIVSRDAKYIQCTSGCSDCCVGGISLTMIEAVSLGKALQLNEQQVCALAGKAPLSQNKGCALLNQQGCCTVYEHRPIVCRIHGIPMLYADRNGLSICNQNYINHLPEKSSVIDVASLTQTLFAVNAHYCKLNGLDSSIRVPIDQLANTANT